MGKNNKFKNVKTHNISVKRRDDSYFDVKNRREFNQQYNMLKMLALSVFKWEGLPESIDELYLERILFENGRVLFFEDTDMAIDGVESTMLALMFTTQSDLDVYGYPIQRLAVAQNGYTASRNSSDSVIMYDNMLKLSLEETINIYAQRLADVERIIDVNLENTKHPFIIKTSEKNKQEIEKIMKDIYNNKPLIMVDDETYDTFSTKSEVMNMNSNFLADKLMDYKNTLRNEIFTIIGIGNSSQDKRERLLSGEMDNVSMLNTAFATTRLRARKQAVKKIKEMFPQLKDLNVEFNTDDYDFSETKVVEEVEQE